MTDREQNQPDTSEKAIEEIPPVSERRGDPRHLACFPAHVETPSGEQQIALIHDLSISGALLLTRVKPEVGDVMRLSLYVKEGEDARLTSARVVRTERRNLENAHPWTMAVAVSFDNPIPELDPIVKALAARQAALAGRKPKEP